MPRAPGELGRRRARARHRAPTGAGLPLAFAGWIGAALPACGGGGAGDDVAAPAAVAPDVAIEGPTRLAWGGVAAFRVSAWHGARPAPGEPVGVRTVDGRRAFDGVTGATGICDVRFGLDTLGLVATPDARDIELVFEVGPPQASYRTSRTVPVGPAWRPLLEVDHRHIAAGGTVGARMTVLHPDHLAPIAGVPGAISLLAPGGPPVLVVEGTSDEGGVLRAALPIQPEAPWGAWTVRGGAGGSTAEAPLTVLPPPSGEAPVSAPPEPPRPAPADLFDVLVVPGAGLLAGGLDNPLAALVTLAGRPAEGADVSVRIDAPGGARTGGRTGERGEAWMVLPVPAGGGPLAVVLRVSDEAGRHLERRMELPRHARGGGLVVRPTTVVPSPGRPLRVDVLGAEGAGPVHVDAYLAGRLVATEAATVVDGKATVDLHPAEVGAGLVWVVASRRAAGGAAGAADFGAAAVFLPPREPLRLTVVGPPELPLAGQAVQIAVQVEDAMARPTAARVAGLFRQRPAGEAPGDPPESAAADLRRRVVEALAHGAAMPRHPAGDLVDLLALGLSEPLDPAAQTVVRAHFATLRPDPAPGPWPAGGEGDGAAGHGASRHTAGPLLLGGPALPPADAVAAFPSGIQAAGAEGVTIEVPTVDDRGALEGAVLALGPGRLGVREVAIPVDRPFELSTRAPATLTVGDRLTLPTTVTNLTERPLDVDVRIELADWFELADVQQTRVRPGALASEPAGFDIVARKPGRAELRVVARTPHFRRMVVAPVTVVPDGQPLEVVRAGVLRDRETVVKFALPALAPDVPERGVITFDPSRDSVVRRALRAALAASRPDLAAEAAVARSLARVATARDIDEPGLVSEARAELGPAFQRLLRFRSAGGGWSWGRGGAPDGPPGRVAAQALALLARAGVAGALALAASAPAASDAASEAAGAGGAPGTPAAAERTASGEGEGEGVPTLEALLQSREGDGGWGSLDDTDTAIAALLSGAALTTQAVEVFVELDGAPLAKQVFDPGSPSLAIPLPEQMKPGPHAVRVVVPATEVGVPWTLALHTAAQWAGRAPAPAGWEVKLKAPGKARVAEKAALKVSLARTDAAGDGPAILRLPLPPGGQAVRADLDDAVTAGQISSYELRAGAVDLHLPGRAPQPDAPAAPGAKRRKQAREKLGLSVGFVPATAGRFRLAPVQVRRVDQPGVVAYGGQGPTLAIR